jgi:dsDNA-specific endonuclease/ATPase MutS2
MDDSPGDEPIRLPIEDFLDLHPFAPAEIPLVVRDYLDEAARMGFTEVRLIHGRGIGAQREAVRRVCAKHPNVVEYEDATPERGGWGATIVRLKRG